MVEKLRFNSGRWPIAASWASSSMCCDFIFVVRGFAAVGTMD
jgi:hypothetical protein